MARARCWCLAIAAAFLYAGSLAAATSSSCTVSTSGQSQLFGVKKSEAKYVDNTSLAKRGPLSKISLYFHKSSGCLRGAKAVFKGAEKAGLIGTAANATETELRLKEGEYVTKAEYKSKQCIEHVKLYTSTGRSLSVGSSSAPGSLVLVKPNKTGTYLVAMRGFQWMPNNKPGALQQLQFVWGTQDCPEELLSMETGTLKPVKTGKTKGAVKTLNTNPGKCAPRLDMCNEKASMNSFSYCVWNAPYTQSTCKGGCCVSSGKCASSSCAISGVGRDAANMICYGTNSGFGFGGNNMCSGLACKLEVPGCTTDAFGGNCVGTVVAFGDKSQLLPEAKRYIGAPCLDATPSDTTLDASGSPATGSSGIYMGKLWTICDCSDDPSQPVSPAALLVNLTATGLSNLTKNDVMLAISQVLPKVNLTETLKRDEDDRSLFPSFTDFFKTPTMPTITLPSFVTTTNNNNGGGNGSSIEIKLPDLGQLLSSLAAKAKDATAEVDAAVKPDEDNLPFIATPAAAVTAAPKLPSSTGSSSSNNSSNNVAEALEGLRGFLGKLVPNLNKANITASSSRSSSDEPSSSSSTGANTPVSIAAVPAAVAAETQDVAPAVGLDYVAVASTPEPAAATDDDEQQQSAQQVAPRTTGAAEPATTAPEPAAAAPAAEATAATPPVAATVTEPTPAAAAAAPAAEATPTPLAAGARVTEPTPVAAAAAAPAAEATAATPPAAARVTEPTPVAAAAAAPEPVAAPEPAARANTAGAFKGFSGSRQAIQQIMAMLPPEAFAPAPAVEQSSAQPVVEVPAAVDSGSAQPAAAAAPAV